ncbi:MAG: excinuclease ABC subunit UvrC [Candidatus Neomarinimicrobiota bacterium]
MTLRIKLRNLPVEPGVYFFKDIKNEILYIGKAKNLRNRVRSYFQKNKYQTAKNQSMIARIKDLEWLVVRTEVEALLTEANLIKKHKPHYNISLKDDKTFPYIRITNEPYPRIFITRNIIKDGSKYFGPYTNIHLLRQSLKAVHKIFPVRSCDFFLDRDIIAKKKVKLCLDYHIKKCEGPCEGLVSREYYGKMINRVKLFLLGKTRETEIFIKKEMELASNELRFEDAVMYRDQLKAIINFREKQRKIAADFQDRDVFALAQQDKLGIMVVVRIRSGRIFSREKIYLQKLDDKQSSIFESVLTQFYLDTDFIPSEITVAVMPDNKSQIINFLKEKQNGALAVVHWQSRRNGLALTAMAYWLMKSEPNEYSWDDLVAEKRDYWDGVRNYQASNNMKAMKLGDRAFFYHSVNEKQVVGIVEVVKEYYPDPTDAKGRFGMVDVKALAPFNEPVTLAQIKAEPRLAEIALVRQSRQSRLSVLPLRAAEWKLICKMGGTEP